MYSYLMVDKAAKKSSKGIKECLIKRKKIKSVVLKQTKIKWNWILIKFKCFLNGNSLKRTSKQQFKNDSYDLSTVKINKVTLSNKNNKRLQIIDHKKIFTYVTSLKILDKSLKFSGIKFYNNMNN